MGAQKWTKEKPYLELIDKEKPSWLIYSGDKNLLGKRMATNSFHEEFVWIGNYAI
jgi:hypothetical protein